MADAMEAAEQLNPLRDGVVHMQELPVADGRTRASEMISSLGSVTRDAHGAYLITKSAGVSFALRHPDLLPSKRAFDSLGSPFPTVPAATNRPEQLLGVEDPVTVPRAAIQDVQITAHTIPADSMVGTPVATANRDAAAHSDPHAIDFERKQKHCAFGGGPHACLGSHLARLEMRGVMEERHRRIPSYRLGPGGSDRVEWPAGQIGIDSLPPVFPPGGGPV